MYPFGTRHLFVSHLLNRVSDMDGSDNPNGGWFTRATPENQQETGNPGSSEAIRQPSRESERDEEMVHALRRRRGSPSELEETGPSEIPCRVSSNLPLERAISLANPANNGELL